MKDIGGMGEDLFSMWCNHAGLVPNGSRIDKAGWDFLVEFPMQSNNGHPFDMGSAPMECRVQVKATEKPIEKWQIKLLNLYRLAKVQMPAFIFIVQFDDNGKEIEAFLVHLDDDYIGKILKRVRKEDVEERANDLHKKTMVVKCRTCDQLMPLNARSLRAKMEKAIIRRGGMEAYIEWKSKRLSSLGFEQGGVEVMFGIPGNNPIERFIDMELGLRDEIEVSNVLGVHKRFGIKSKSPFFTLESAKLKITSNNPPLEAELIFREFEFSPKVVLPAKLYGSTLNMHVPKEQMKFRLEGEFFDFLISSKHGNANFNFSFERKRKYEIGRLLDMAQTFVMFGNSKRELFCEIRAEGKRSISSRITTKGITGDWRHLFEIVDMAYHVCWEFGWSNDVLVSIEQIESDIESLQAMNYMLKGDMADVAIAFDVCDTSYIVKSKTAILMFFSTTVGDYAMGCAVAFLGTSEKDDVGGGYKMKPKANKIGQKLIITTAQVLSDKEILLSFESLENELEDQGYETIRIEQTLSKA